LLLRGRFLYWRVISFPLHNIRLDFFDLLTFYSRFYLLTERMPLKSWLPLLVECRIFNRINCDLCPYFSDGYAILEILIFLIKKIGNHRFYLNLCNSCGEGLNFLKNKLVFFFKKKLVMNACNVWKSYIFFFFNTTLICFTDIHPSNSHRLWLGGWFLYRWVISRPEHNIWFNFCDLLTFYSWYNLITGRMPLKFRLPILVQCRFFVPINCNLGSYFSHFYAIFKILTF